MFKRFSLDTGYTPLQHSPEFSEFLGVPFYVKREDLCASSLSLGGSDARKVEFLLPAIAAQRPDVVLVLGSYRSQFARILVQVLSANGIRSEVVFLDEFSQECAATLSDIQLCGATTHGTQTQEFVNAYLAEASSAGTSYYIVRPGGASSVAMVGGYALFEEIQFDLRTKFDLQEGIIYVESSSGTTHAGMLAAQTVSNEREPHGLKSVGVTSNDPEAQLLRVSQNYADFCTLANDPELPEARDFVISESLPEVIQSTTTPLSLEDKVRLLRRFHISTGIMLDISQGLPVLAALVHDVQQNKYEMPFIFVNPVRSSTPFFSYNT